MGETRRPREIRGTWGVGEIRRTRGPKSRRTRRMGETRWARGTREKL